MDNIEAINNFEKAHDTLDDTVRGMVIKRMLAKEIPDLTGKDVLDVGGGGGIWTDYFIRQGATVTVVEKNLLINRGNQLNNPEAEYITGDATTQRYNKQFDLIFTKDVIEHIMLDRIFLKNQLQWLKDDGVLMLTTHNSLSLNYLIDGGIHFLTGRLPWCGYDSEHLRFYDYWRLNNDLKKAGYNDIKYWSTYHFPDRIITKLIFNRFMESKLSHLVDYLKLNSYFPFNITGWNIGVMARKRAEE